MMTYDVETVARMTKASGQLTAFGKLVIDSESLRLVDHNKPDFKIDVLDPRFTSKYALLNWPFSQSADYLLGVELQWVLSTVKIRKILHLSVLCPWNGTHNYANIFKSSEWELKI